MLAMSVWGQLLVRLQEQPWTVLVGQQGLLRCHPEEKGAWEYSDRAKGGLHDVDRRIP